MAEDTTASVIPLHQAPAKKKARTSAAGAKTNRRRKRQATKPTATTEEDSSASAALIPPEFTSIDLGLTEATVTPLSRAMPHASRPLARPRRRISAMLLSAAALALAGVGITMNGSFARSLGSSDIASWLFLAIGVAADLVALVMPTCAAALWQAGQRITALVAWTFWAMTFVFAVTAGIGFASLNIADATMVRASRVTPAVASAQAALNDAMAARDRECRNGVGRFCREREVTVNERRQALDAAMKSVEQSADPQTEAAVRCGQPATTSPCFDWCCWRYCRRSAALCSWSDDRPGEAFPHKQRLRIFSRQVCSGVVATRVFSPFAGLARRSSPAITMAQ